MVAGQPKQPKYPLTEIQAAAAYGGVSRAPNKKDEPLLMAIFGSDLRIYEFAMEIVARLKPGMFYEHQRNEETGFNYDAYGLVLPDDFPETCRPFDRDSWYIGLQFKPSGNGTTVVVSLHPPLFEMKCADGSLVPADSL